MSYQRLMNEHDRIDTCIEALRDEMWATVPNVSGVICTLCDLAHELAHHLAHEDSFIYPKMIGANAGPGLAAAQQFVTEFDELRADWDVYLEEWQPESIADDWNTFRAATCTMMDRLTLRVQAENTLLYTTALQTGAIALRG